MPEIKAIISDLDDTLLTGDGQMTERTAQALLRVQRRGVRVILASGRAAAAMRPFVRRIETPCPFIAFNGAQIVDPKTFAVLDSDEIPEQTARAVLAWFEARAVYTHFYDGDSWYYASPCAQADAYARAVGVAGTCAGRPLTDALRGNVPKVLAFTEVERVRALLPELVAAFGEALTITTSKPYFIEVSPKGVDKGHAVRKLADRLALSPETTLCAGDSLNDLPMLAWSRLPVAVANARDAVRAAAWRIAGDGRSDGIAALLEELIP